MRRFKFSSPVGTNPTNDTIVTEKEIVQEHWDTYRTNLKEQYGQVVHFDIVTKNRCVDDWIKLHNAVQVDAKGVLV